MTLFCQQLIIQLNRQNAAVGCVEECGGCVVGSAWTADFVIVTTLLSLQTCDCVLPTADYTREQTERSGRLCGVWRMRCQLRKVRFLFSVQIGPEHLVACAMLYKTVTMGDQAVTVPLINSK